MAVTVCPVEDKKMPKKIVAVLLVFVFIAGVAAQDDPKIYVTGNLVGIALGAYQLALEFPVSGRQSIYLQGSYFDWQKGYMPEFYAWYMGFLMDLMGSSSDYDYYDSGSNDFLLSYISAIKNIDFKSYGGALGLYTYSSNTGFLRPYSAAYLGYNYSTFYLPPFAIDTGVNTPHINMDAHSAVLAGRFGGKGVLGFLAADLYLELALVGLYMDVAKLLRDTGVDQLLIEMGLKSLLDLYKNPVSVTPSMNFGFVISLAL